MTATHFNVIVLGGGPAGVTAALRARELGASVALIERSLLGGTCTNDGCVPTRVLARAARFMRETRRFADYGLDAPTPTVDFARVLQRAQQVVYQVHEKKQLIAHLDSLGITTLHGVGEAAFADAHTLRLEDGRTFSADKIILCVGGHSRTLNLPGAEHALSHSDVWRMTALPPSVAIVGGGATGCQVASIFNAFGARVSLIDLAPRLLPTEDHDVAEAVRALFVENGIEILTGIKGIERIEKRAEIEGAALDLVVKISDSETRALSTDAVILSVGWPGNLDALNLAAAGVATKGAYIQVDDTLRTSVPHIYAAGDVNGRLMLVQTAGYQARVAVENALSGGERPDRNQHIPHGGFTDPEYGGVGLTEAQAREKGIDCAIAVVPYADMDRAVIDGVTEGFCKLIVDRATRQIVGAHVVGEQAVEVIQIVTTAMVAGMPIEQVADIEFAYPTFAAVIGLAARQLARDLKVVHIAPTWRALIRERIAEWERATPPS
jgi:pyruvate/2-oxoglutarate dehydrogenase complex dihydrolipoamide dehydrogenase (E3) component